MSEVLESPGTALARVEALNPVIVFAPGGVNDILARIETEARATKVDISTPLGRKACAALAYKIARSKNALDGMGKDLTDEWRQRTNAVNEERRTIRARLDALADEVRAPLTAYEERDKARIARHEAALAGIPEHATYGETETAAEIVARLEYLRTYPARDWQEFTERAREALALELARTEGLLARAEKREAEAAELARLREQEAERQRQDAARLQAERETRIAAEAAEHARQAAEAQAKQQAEAERLAWEAKAQQERDAAAAREREAQAAAERAQEQAKKAERDRVEAAEAAERRQAQAVAAERQRAADEKAAADASQAKREVDKAHRSKVNRAVLDALTLLGLSEEHGKAVVSAIARREVPHVSIAY